MVALVSADASLMGQGAVLVGIGHPVHRRDLVVLIQVVRWGSWVAVAAMTARRSNIGQQPFEIRIVRTNREQHQLASFDAQ